MDPLHPIIPNEPRLPILPARPSEAVKRDQRRPDEEGGDGRRDESQDDHDRGQDDADQAAVVDLEAADSGLVASEEWGVYDDHGAYELRVSGGHLHRTGPPHDQPADVSGSPGPNPSAREATPRPADAPPEGQPATPEPGGDADPGWHIDISA
jgi:hypothetical protein